MKEFLKIKKDKTGQIRLEWQVLKKDGSKDEQHYYSYDKPLEEFDNKLANLRKHVLEICEYPVEEERLARVEVTGVSFSYGSKSNVMGASIIAQYQPKDCLAPVNLVTPHKIETFYNESGGDDRSLMSDKMLVDLNALMVEAERYLNGERAQGDLFNQQETKTEAA